MDYVSVRISTLRPGVQLLFDVYVEFKNCKIKYKTAKEHFDEILLGKFKAKQIKKIFIPSEQEPQYLKYLDQVLDMLQVANLPTEARSEMAQGTLKREAENIEKTLETEEAYRDSEARIHKVVDFILNEPHALAGMLASAGLSVDDSSHGSTVCSLGLGVGAKSGKIGKGELTDIAIAALLHDSSLKELGFDVKANKNNISKEDKIKFRSHPQKSVELVAGKKFITPSVLRIIEDHEEFGDGIGFPNKKRYLKLSPDSQIFNLCDAFDHFCIEMGKPAQDCVDEFIEKNAEYYDLELIGVLEKQVKCDLKKTG